MMKLNALLNLFATMLIIANCSAQDWTPLWKSYAAAFMDNQVRVIDHDAGDRTTSEGQAYAMFFALVANDRSRFDGLVHWTETNLASGDLATHLPSWLWGRGPNDKWGVLDSNSASDADVWMAYALLQAGKAWMNSTTLRLELLWQSELPQKRSFRYQGSEPCFFRAQEVFTKVTRTA